MSLQSLELHYCFARAYLRKPAAVCSEPGVFVAGDPPEKSDYRSEKREGEQSQPQVNEVPEPRQNPARKSTTSETTIHIDKLTIG
jgi:hypothetical protein